MSLPRMRALATAAVTLVAAAAFVQCTSADEAALTSASASAPTPTHLENSFERPSAGSSYTLPSWGQDGWDALHGVGWEERTMIDDTHSQDGGKSMRVLYPEGEIGPENSGALAPFQLDAAGEYYLSFWLRFDPDFSWGTTEYAGKVGFGLAGGASCSGGEACDGTNGFNSRMIWRQNDGQAAVYYYHMGKEGQYGDYAVLQDDGQDIHWPTGEWVNVVQRFKVNTVSGGTANPDGEVEIFYNGESAAEVTGLRFVTNDDQVDRAYFSSFAGGATASFAPENDGYIWYDNLKVSTDPADICELGGTC